MPVLNVVIWYQVKVAHKKTFKKDIMAAVIVSFCMRQQFSGEKWKEGVAEWKN